jgi:hypothetical protein
MEGTVRSGRTSWFQRGRMGERRRCGDGALLPYSRTVSNNGKLSPARESQELRLELREVLWVR